ncbi:MAG: YHS domain-containing (seleno)protein [Erythrobacter sp.]
MKLKFLAIAAALAAPLTLAVPANADGGIFVGTSGTSIAVSGYDAVSYFQGSGVPVQGDARFKVEHNGAEWHFSSQANADAFASNPAAYAPQYGGHCAWAMSRGSLAPGDPQLYRIVDGKLYLNFRDDVQRTWLSDIPGFISKADVAWVDIPEGKRFGS